MPAIPDVRPWSVLNANTLGANTADEITFGLWVCTVRITNRGTDILKLSPVSGGAFEDIAPGDHRDFAITMGRDTSKQSQLFIESPTTTQAYKAAGFERVY